ncbi:hypothetical protein NNJEOMEG_01158 [Fundidesulfovibrio magnetotacticus]|uniref:Tetratricopeptide repeat protein n=1 Tax=Fundidesulfovibrio magnetotacticus TaxID=2730080 RepID=A0A6V8LU43_9BACT|nr:hypothetical protein [Fundidesulfovibrio magnetotacticus]GFK93326.1 hypothetical protein NNJEOMEG_01158 [Fundidesulfovibrio magnetotacticus]
MSFPRRAAPLAVLLACLVLLAAPPGARAALRAVVLPLQPAPGAPVEGFGAAVQNIVENALVLHGGFEETFFLNYTEAFDSAGDLQAYIGGQRAAESPLPGLARRGVRLALGGTVEPGSGTTRQARLWLKDLETGERSEILLPVDPLAGLTGLRSGLIPLLEQAAGRPFNPAQAKALRRPEILPMKAFSLLGHAYASYLVSTRARIRPPFRLSFSARALELAPNSATALNMHGWLLHASGDDAPALTLFRKALDRDPSLVDALDGMARLTLDRSGQEQALPWVLRKTRTRDEGVGPGLARVHHHLAGMAKGSDRNRVAAWHLNKATVLDPAWDRPLLELTLALSRMERFEDARRALDKRLAREKSPALRTRYLEQMALVRLWESQAAQREKKTPQRVQALEQAVELAAVTPGMARDLRWRVRYELADALCAGGEPGRAAQELSAAEAANQTEQLLQNALMAFCLARSGRSAEARALAWETLSATAEQERRRDPVPRRAYESLGRAFDALDRQELARIMERHATPHIPDPAK